VVNDSADVTSSGASFQVCRPATRKVSPVTLVLPSQNLYSGILVSSFIFLFVVTCARPS